MLPFRAKFNGGALNQYHLISFDPGGTTGWAHFVLSYRAFSRPEHKVLAHLISWDCGEFTGDEKQQLGLAVGLITRNIRGGEFRPRMDVVGEHFDLTQLVGGSELLSPVRINAVLDWECGKLGLRYQEQGRQLRTNKTPERVLTMGFYSPLNRGGRWTKTGRGKDAFAAMQHGIVWLQRLKRESIGRPWKLSDAVSSNARWDCSCEEKRRGNRMKCNLIHPQ